MKSDFAEQLGMESTEETTTIDMVKKVFDTVENREVKEKLLPVEAAFKSGVGIVFASHHDPFFPGQKVPNLRKVRSLFERHKDVRFVDVRPGKRYEIDTAVREA